MLHMISHAIFGLIIGLIARAILPGRQHMGLILTMILGLVGAWLGGLLGRVTGIYKEEGHPALVHGAGGSGDSAVHLLAICRLIVRHTTGEES